MSEGEDFSAEYEAWQKHTRELWPDDNTSAMHAHSKRGIAMFRALHEKWHPRMKDSPLRKRLEDLEVSYAQVLEQILEGAFWRDLQIVIGARSFSFATEGILKATLERDPRLEDFPDEFRPIMAQRLAARPENDRGRDAIRQEMENYAGEVDARARAHHAQLVAEWPERMSARMRERLTRLDAADAKDWMAEINLFMPLPLPSVVPPPAGGAA